MFRYYYYATRYFAIISFTLLLIDALRFFIAIFAAYDMMIMPRRRFMIFFFRRYTLLFRCLLLSPYAARFSLSFSPLLRR